MALQLGDTAPDFEAETTEGPIRFHDWLGDSWGVLFSHPKDFTPVCTTELGYMAKIKPEFDKRNVKIVGLSVDPVDKHSKWASDIEETQGNAPNYPMIGDSDFNVSKLYGMLPASTSGDRAEQDGGGAPPEPLASYEACSGSTGSSTRKVVPRLSALSTPIDPLCASTIAFAIDRPRTDPGTAMAVAERVRKKRSNSCS